VAGAVNEPKNKDFEQFYDLDDDFIDDDDILAGGMQGQDEEMGADLLVGDTHNYSEQTL
jgi:hypothetical protein